VNILSDKQADISDRFARSNSNKFEGLDYKKSQQGLPQLNGISAYFECRTEARHYSGDHVIFIGHVINYQYNGSPTLVYSRGQYKILES
jgi:3-hydroxy-9,10-secoandrosta-1,3,5(10)-triene-9,17-dione monooxygenase reductase component